VTLSTAALAMGAQTGRQHGNVAVFFQSSSVAQVRSFSLNTTNLPLHGFAEKNGPACDPDISAHEIQGALMEILAHTLFSRSQRMSHLLQFLVMQASSGKTRTLNEYAVGLEVFGRDPATYSTSEDPIVRVQVGRLREKLRAYYLSTMPKADIVISIPIGSYVPVIRRSGAKPLAKPPELSMTPTLIVAPLTYISVDASGSSFTQGLCEELIHRLFHDFDYRIVPHAAAGVVGTYEVGALTNVGKYGVSHVLEGSVRVNGNLMRASFRLVDAIAGCLAWVKQFDRRTLLSILLQEEIATAIGVDLTRYFGSVHQAHDSE